MEMRTLSQCLRSTARPTPTSLLYTKQFARQSLPAIRYNSSSSSSSSSSSFPFSPASPSTPSTSTSTSAFPKRTPSAFPTFKPQGAFGGGGAPTSPKPTSFNARANANADADATLDELFDKLRLGGRHALSNESSGATGDAGLSAPESSPRLTPKLELKLGPSLGRQVFVEPDRGNDLSAALRMLGARLAQARLKRMVNEQKFHVRKGQLRKEKRSGRWRKLFKFSFNDTLHRVQKMRAQGW